MQQGSLDYSPTSWDQYFTKKSMFQIPNTNNFFQIYEIGDPVQMKTSIVLHHGGGHSALSWALCAKELSRLLNHQVHILAFDCRGHGGSKVEPETDLSLETLSEDLITLIQEFYGKTSTSLFLVGHSMGGAIVTHAASLKKLKIQGISVLDVVEGTAMEALEGYAMINFVSRRPSIFRSYNDAIEWSIKHDIVRSLESAKVSIPPQLKVIPNPLKSSSEDLNDMTPTQGKEYTWRTDLLASEKYWKGWYQGMSAKFLTCPASKLLILAGTDRLDKDLTIGQMQGKFQMRVLPMCGHIVQEDAAQNVASALAEFVQRNQPLDIAAIRAKKF